MPVTDNALRPTSPHLSIYRWKITMVGSILHRITGVALYAGALLLVAWLWSAGYHARSYQCLHRFMSAWYGQVVLFGWAWTFYYHLCNGIRHLWWDTGRGLVVQEANRTGWAVLLASIVFTAVTWWLAYRGI